MSQSCHQAVFLYCLTTMGMLEKLLKRLSRAYGRLVNLHSQNPLAIDHHAARLGTHMFHVRT